ncbi:MAG: ATP-binding protein [Chitinophagales bacterium]
MRENFTFYAYLCLFSSIYDLFLLNLRENFTIMLIRFVVKNLFSFNEATEFNMLPSKATRLKHHKYKLNDEIEVLKLAAIYGANASGKSNLVKSFATLKKIILSGKVPFDLNLKKFKLSNGNINKPIEFSVEFYTTKKFYYYTISILANRIVEEYLCEVVIGKEDRLIFHRETDENNINSVTFFNEFYKNEKNILLKEIIESTILKYNQSLLDIIDEFDKNSNQLTDDEWFDIFALHAWLEDEIKIVSNLSLYSRFLPLQLNFDTDFKKFAIQILSTYSTGITDIVIEKIPIELFFGSNNLDEINKIINSIETNNDYPVYKMINNEVVNFIKEKNKILAVQLKYIINNDEGNGVVFRYNELSDGTKKLVDYLRILDDVINSECSYMIDEVEKSIHPLLIKEIISKFSKEENTKGQLIFTSHECNLLDQDILRTDEIWFAEKNKKGETKLYSLSDFKEHSTIDIRKGYLQGRYGGIPFISNLQDLNWHKEDVVEK